MAKRNRGIVGGFCNGVIGMFFCTEESSIGECRQYTGLLRTGEGDVNSMSQTAEVGVGR